MSETTPTPLKRLPRFKPRSGLVVMYASIRALFLRELQTRFGHYRIGYVWALIEPMLDVIFFLVLFGTLVQRVMPGIDYSLFLLNGVLPYYLFQKSTSRALGAIEANLGLLSYRSVQPIDIIIARTFLEFILYFICYAVLMFVLVWVGYAVSFSYLPQLICYWGLLFIFSLGFASTFMVIGTYSQDINKAIGTLFTIIYFLSGAMFPLHRIPAEYLSYVMWNPLAHLFELMRHAIAPNYQMVEGTSVSYFIIWCMVMLFLGLALSQIFKQTMLKSK